MRFSPRTTPVTPIHQSLHSVPGSGTITLNLTRRKVQMRNRDRGYEAEYLARQQAVSPGESPLKTLLKAEQTEQLNIWLSQIPEP